MKNLISTSLLALALTLAGQAAEAALTAGPPDAKGFPTTLADGKFVLDQCGTVRPGLVGGPCELGEPMYYALDTRQATATLSRLQLVVEVAPLVAPVAAGGKQVVNEMRLRMVPAGKNIIQEGTYNVTTPFGDFTFTVPGGPKATTKKVDILIIRNDLGQLVVGEPVPVPIPLAEGAPIPGPIDRFIPAAVAPPGFLGDMGDPAIPLSAKAKAMGPPPTGEQPLVGGGIFRVVLADGTPTGTLIGESDKFFVLGSVVKTINAPEVVPPVISVDLNGNATTITSIAPNTFGMSAAAFGTQLPPPAVAATDPAMATMTVAPPTITGPFNPFPAKALPPQKIVQVSGLGGSLTNPSQVSVTQVPDAVSGTASFNARTGVLLIKASSNQAKLPIKQRPALTATVNTATPQTVKLNTAGNATVRLGRGAAKPTTISVTSTAGGTVIITPSCKPATAAACTALP